MRSGIWSVELAKRGWQVVGIDNVPRAVEGARKRAKAGGVDVRFVEGDVTTLREAGVGNGFQFFLDLGCIHGLNDKHRLAVGSEVNAAAAPDAVLLTLVWAPAHRGPLPRGASGADLESAFRGWKIVDEDPLDAAALPGLRMKLVDSVRPESRPRSQPSFGGPQFLFDRPARKLPTRPFKVVRWAVLHS